MFVKISVQTGTIEFDDAFGQFLFSDNVQARLQPPDGLSLDAYLLSVYLLGAQTALRVANGLPPFPDPDPSFDTPRRF